MINNKNFFDNYFKFLVLLFWPMIWYKKEVAVSSHPLEIGMVTFFTILATVYIILFLKHCNNASKTMNIVVSYRISILLSFIFTLYSYIIFTTSILWLLLKVIFVLLCLYISSIKLIKYKIDEGLVGILSSVLLLIITLLY